MSAIELYEKQKQNPAYTVSTRSEGAVFPFGTQYEFDVCFNGTVLYKDVVYKLATNVVKAMNAARLAALTEACI